MKLLFTSDLHGEERAFARFGSLLSRPIYLGIIAGDLQEEQAFGIDTSLVSLDGDRQGPPMA